MLASQAQKQEIKDYNYSTRFEYKTRKTLPVALISLKDDTQQHRSLQKIRNHYQYFKSSYHSKQKNQGHRFSKQKRFSSSQNGYYHICKLQIPSTKTKLTCTFGYGERQPISKIILKKASLTPSPNKYSINSALNTQGRSFANSSRQSELHRYINHRTDVYSPHFNIHNPGPIYNVRLQMNAKPITIKKKLKMYTQKVSQTHSFVPGPKYTYTQSNTSVTQKGPTFKTGKRTNLSQPLNNAPGPKYKVFGFCDKFKPEKLYKNKNKRLYQSMYQTL